MSNEFNRNKEILWKLLSEKDKNFQVSITNKYRNYIFAIINKKLQKIGYQNNSFIDQIEIFNETISAIFNLSEEKIKNIKFSTLVGYSAVFSTFKYLRKMNNFKNKISFLCGKKTQEFFDLTSQKQVDSNIVSEPLVYENQLIILKEFFVKINPKTKKEKEINNFVYKILILKIQGLTNSEVALRLNVSRRKVYDHVKRWFNKHGLEIKKYLNFD